MKTITAKFLSFIFLLNTLFFGISFQSVYAADAFAFEWNKENILNDGLNIVSKGDASDNVFLWWDFGKRNGSSFDRGTYTLSYNIKDGKRVDFEIVKNGSVANVTYKVFDYATSDYISLSDTLFQVYRDTDGIYIAPTAENFPNATENFGVVYDGPDGKPTKASFNITQSSGFAFKYDNETIKFQWVKGTDNDIMYYVTSGIQQGNVYDFDLKLNIPGESEISNNLQIFTGINANSFRSTPYANDRHYEIDHTERPFTGVNANDPGHEPELVLDINMPKVWDDATKSYVYIDPSSATSDDITSLVVSLGNIDDSKKIQVSIANIYANNPNTGATYTIGGITGQGGDGRVNVTRDVNNSTISINITNLQPGVIYNPAEISLYKPNNGNFLADVTTIPHGKVYTYPVYTVEAISAEQFYLKIQPFEGYKGYYIIKSGATTATLTNWAQVEDSKGGTEPIYVPVNINAINKQTQCFQIDFVFTPPDSTPGTSQVTLESQILKFKPDDSDVVISTPANFEVISAEVVPSNPGASTENELLMTLRWDMGYETVLKNILNKNGGELDVYYEFNRGEVPYDENEQQFAKIKLHLTLAGDEIKITADKEDGVAEIEEDSFKYDTYDVLMGTTRYTVVRPTITFRMPTAPKADKNQLFLYPNVYFLNLSGYYTDNKTYVKIPASLYDDVTLDDVVDYDVPEPQNVRVVTAGDKAIGKTEFTVEWDTFDIDDIDSLIYKYREKMLLTRKYDFGDKSIKFNAYVTQDKANFDNLIQYNNNRDEIPGSISGIIKTFDFGGKTADAGLDFSANSAVGGTVLRDELRNNQIVKIENIMHDPSAENQSFTLRGLDKNQPYYVILETVVVPYDTVNEKYLDEEGNDETDLSGYSSIVTATTLPDEDVPGPEDNYPEAPDNFTKDDITLNSVKLMWDKVIDGVEYPNSSLEYQFIRINGEQMDEATRASRKDYAEIWEKVNTGVKVAGWQTLKDSIYEFNGTDFSETPASAERFGYDPKDVIQNILYDRTLSPNQLYFYYLRTVRIVDGKPVAYSIWVPLSVTTTPVESPYNLKIEKGIKHDKESQVVISFDTPYFDTNLLGTEYDIQYALKQDTELWENPVTMKPETLKANKTENPDGTLHFTYTIGGLEQGKLYFIKVRILNNTLNEASIYSNTEKHRTDVDAVDQDRQEEIDGWIDRLKELLEEELDDPYWILDDTTANTVVYYRPQHFQSVINEAVTGVINLPPGEFGAKKIYYIPASAVKQAYDANKGFKVSWKDADVIVGARAIDPALNEAIRQVLDRMDHDHVEDYFIKITAYFNPVSYTIENTDPLSPIIDVEVDAVGVDEDIQEWDDERVDDIIEWIKDTVEDNYDDIVDEIDDADKDEDMVKFIKDLVIDFNEDTHEEFLDDLDDIIDRSFATEQLEASIIIAYPAAQGVTVSGRRQVNGVWTGATVSEYMGKKAIYTKNPGIYVFLGKAVIIPEIANIPNGQLITNIVAKYGLEDFLGKGTALNINAPLTRNAALGCSARISGADKTAEPIAFFTSKGVNLLVKNKQGDATNQEAVYLTMMVYQVRKNVKIDTVQIRNFAATSNIKGIQPVFKKSVQSAFELGVYTNSGMNPNGIMTIKDYLQMLANISAKVNL